jgi:hypothetical protein
MGDFEKGMDWLEDAFVHHPPTKDQIPRYEAIRNGAKDFAKILLDQCATSADRSHALRMVRTAVMFANASIALNGKG